MNVGFLYTNIHLNSWISQAYPFISTYSEVTPQLLSQDIIILHEHIEIHEKSYSLLKLWKKFLETSIDMKGKKLLQLGWQDHPSSNYLSIHDMPPNLSEHFQKVAKSIKSKPCYPEDPGRDFASIISASLTSHKSSNFYDLVFHTWKSLKALELKLKDLEIYSIHHTDEYLNGKRVVRNLKNHWNMHKAY